MTKSKGIRLRRRITTYMPEESWGACGGCGIEAVLADGLCVSCWDATEPQSTTKLKQLKNKDKVMI